MYKTIKMKNRMYLKTIVICITLLVAGYQSSSAQQKGLLWEISGKGMKQPAYLFGTIHMYDTSVYQLPQPPFALLDKVKKAYFELDFGKIDMGEMMSSIFIKDSTQNIDKLLDSTSLTKLNKMIAASASLKMLGNRVYTIKPFLLLSIMMGGDGKIPSVDMELYKAALSKKDSVGGLETLKEQLAAVDAISIPAQVEMLRESLVKDRSLQEILNKLTNIYIKQDIENMLTELEDDMAADVNFNQKLAFDRNIVMADRIDVLLRTESPLIAVGAGHLGTSAGLIALLRKRGYKLKNIPFTIQKAHL
jgi:uncharacterized protein YbaP (TraB family)